MKAPSWVRADARPLGESHSLRQPLRNGSHQIYCVYVLRSDRDQRLYTGVTADLKRRLREHNSGRVRSTSSRRPLSLIYFETFETKAEALARETYFKTPEGGLTKQRLVADKAALD